MKFLCDEMLADLGKWLRVAGYDTLIAEEASNDHHLLELALAEKRILLTRDSHFLTMNAAQGHFLYLTGHNLKEYMQQIKTDLSIPLLYKPLSRCIVCNGLLTNPDAETINHQVPQDILDKAQGLKFCPHCNKVYWEGSHTEHMLSQLASW